MTTTGEPRARGARVEQPSAMALTSRRKKLVLGICCVSLFMNYLDSTILNVALPALQKVFHADEAQLQWIVDSFLLVLTCFLILAGTLADRLGRRSVLVTGLAVFTIGSIGCSLSGSADELIVARVFAGLGGCMLVPTTLSIIRNTFTERADLARAIGVWSGVYGVACACGPILGGFLVDTTGWRSIFYVNIPVGLVGIYFAFRYIPESTATRARRVDVPGQLFIIAILFTLVLTIIEAPSYGWTSTFVAGGFGLTLLLLVPFLYIESQTQEPLFEIHFFKNPAFAGANFIALVTFILMSGFLFLNTIYLQQVRELSALQAGIFTLPLMIAITVCAPISGRYMSRHGPRMAMVFSSLFVGSAYVMLLFTHARTSSLYLCVAYVSLGAGLGSVNPTLTHTSVSSMPAEQGGVASAITSTSRQIGSALGVAVLGSLVVTSFTATISPRLSAAGLSRSLNHQVTSAGISSLSSSYGPATAAVRSIAQASYSDSLHVAWWIGVCLSFLWFCVALRASTPSALAGSQMNGDRVESMRSLSDRLTTTDNSKATRKITR